MREVSKRTNVGYEIQFYHPKVHGEYTEMTGQNSRAIQCDNIGEVAQFFARQSWGSIYENSNCARPTVYYNGKPWCRGEYSEVEK